MGNVFVCLFVLYNAYNGKSIENYISGQKYPRMETNHSGGRTLSPPPLRIFSGLKPRRRAGGPQAPFFPLCFLLVCFPYFLPCSRMTSRTRRACFDFRGKKPMPCACVRARVCKGWPEVRGTHARSKGPAGLCGS